MRLTENARHVDHRPTAWTSLGREVEAKQVWVLRVGFTAIDAPLAAGDRADRAAAHAQRDGDLALRQSPFL